MLLRILGTFLCAGWVLAGDLQLPPPQTEGGKPLMQALKLRQSSRSFSPEKLSPQMLSNLLWAAFGINRPESGKHTAPSASNRQEIDVYAAMAEGLFLYDAKAHMLRQVLASDLRAATGRQDFAQSAPLNLVYVADLAKAGKGESRLLYTAADTGFISQNVYLFCASEGLATVVRGMVDRPALAKAMQLRADQEVMLAQTVGYPGKQP
jgi:SagB-type dehydrogenase family enzyme